MPEVLAKKVNKKSTTKPSKSKYSEETCLNWYESMLRIRKFEEHALFAYSLQKIRGFLHVYIGQEAIGAALTSGITADDKIVTAYRQHGIALIRGLSSKSCMAELYGKATGCVKGKGGSMHFFSKEHNYFGGNGIVGAQIPIGTGIGFAEKYKGTKNISVTMFGDGAARQGALHESFNMAQTWKLPVLFIVENNGYAMGTSVERTSNMPAIHLLGEGYGMAHSACNGMDVMETHEAIKAAADYIRSGKGPYFLEINTYRYRGHSVSDPGKYRTKEELNEYKAIDPIITLAKYIVDNKISTQKKLDKISDNIVNEIKEAAEFAENSPYPLASDLYNDNYTQKDYPFIMD